VVKRGFVLGTLVLVGALSGAVGAMQQPAGRQGGGQGAQAPAQPTPSAALLQADKLRDNLYVIKAAPNGGFSGGNTAVFIQANGVTVVDTKVPGWGQPLIDKIKELTDKPITTVINTHTHFDHAGGNPEFPTTVEVVTHENTARLMREGNPVTGLQGTQPNVFKDSGGRGLPKRTYKDRMTLGSGNDRVELHYFGRAHTGGDTFVVFPAARVLHTGDAFPNKGNPIMDANNGGSGVDYADTIAKAAALPNIETVVTGHAGNTMTMADVKEYSDFIRELVSSVRAAKKAGQTVDDAINWKVPERFLKSGYNQPMPQALRSNVQVIWNEIK
jgi:glyoxylase-like metal-dependent hydrolase (beta-lactamase superfamily II)